MATEWPRFADYNAAFHDPKKGLIPLELKGATVARNGFGSPDPLSGGFAYIYRLSLPGNGQKAVRVFIQEDPLRDRRLPWVMKRLEEVKLQYPALKELFLPCHWIDPCVRTPKADVPALVMDWSEGQTLGEWLRKHRGNSAAILEFRERFFRMMELLEQAGIAHGDLQVGNILVNREGHPVLVDYDGVAFFEETVPPPLQGGHPNFQHPFRPNSLPSEQLDRFPAITIDLGLLSWSLFSESFWFLSLVSDSDRLYFSRSDFLAPSHSEAFGRLREHPQLATAANELEALCTGDPTQVPTLSEFRSRAYPLEVKAVPVVEPTALPEDSREAVKPKGRRKGKSWKETETEYLPVFPLYSATDVLGLRARVGEMVEVIGKITEIHEGETKYGDPYVFVNFMDWRERFVFHLVAWSEDLEELTEAPNEEWVGKWIQVTGLLEEPYIRKSYSGGMGEQVRYSIRLRQDHQFRFLSPQKAKARLKSAVGTSYPEREPSRKSSSSVKTVTFSGTAAASRQEKLLEPEKTGQVSHFNPHKPEPPVPTNQELLNRLQTLSTTSPSLSSSSRSSGQNAPATPGRPPSTTPSAWQGSGAGQGSSSGKPPPASDNNAPWIFWLILLGLFFYLFALLAR